MKTFLLFLLINQFCFCQLASNVKLNPKHIMVTFKTVTTSENGKVFFVIDKTDSTYFYKYETFSGCVRELITSKGKIKIQNDTLILKTILPDDEMRNFDYTKKPDRKFSYIKPIKNKLSKEDEIKIYIAKNSFSYGSFGLDNFKMFVDKNDNMHEIKDFKIIPFEEEYYYITLDKNSYKNKRISLILFDNSFLIDFNEVIDNDFIFDPLDYPFNHYQNMTNFKYKIKGNNYSELMSNNHYTQWFMSR